MLCSASCAYCRLRPVHGIASIRFAASTDGDGGVGEVGVCEAGVCEGDVPVVFDGTLGGTPFGTLEGTG